MVAHPARAIPGSFTPTDFVLLRLPADTGVVLRPGFDSSKREMPGLTAMNATNPPLPMSRAEMLDRGWDEVDVVFVTGDAYVDHPSFAAAILARVLEATGFRVGIVSQPAWHNCDAWKEFGRPRLFFAISAGNMDSMINHYTANKKVRNDDAYSPGGRIGLRPDRATLVYCQRAREAYKGVPVIAGGVEASLRRLAHYDYWSDTVKRSILLDSKADLVVFGMGESAIVEIAQRLATAASVASTIRTDGSASPSPSKEVGACRSRDRLSDALQSLRAVRGVAYVLGAKEAHGWVAQRSAQLPEATVLVNGRCVPSEIATLPSYEQVKSDKPAFAEATRIIHMETNPYNARTLAQWHDRQLVVCNPPRLPESPEAMDFYYGLPYTRKPHPRYKEAIPAYEMIKDSVTIMRGCFGGCTYCSITTHQGRIIQSRSKQSITREIASMAQDKDFKGVVSDIGGPTANMYEMRCLKPEIEAICRRLSCVHPKVCPLLGTDHKALIDVMREARNQDGVRKVLVASGVRMDLARLSPEYMHELTTYHVGGHLKVAQEHTDSQTLSLMKRPAPKTFEDFEQKFRAESKKAGKKQYLIPYFISAHPGTDLAAMIDLALFLKEHGYKPEQVQDFIPAPFDIAACMYHTGLDPITKNRVNVAKGLRDRKMQRALMQFFKPENYFTVRKALLEAGRRDLIGEGCHALIPNIPPKAAFAARMRQVNHGLQRKRRRGEAQVPQGRGQMGAGPSMDPIPTDLNSETSSPPDSIDHPSEDHVHSPRRYATPGYRPNRRTARRRERSQ